jgi:hypothetical protein
MMSSIDVENLETGEARTCLSKVELEEDRIMPKA